MQLQFGPVLSRRRVVVASGRVKVGRLERLHPMAGADEGAASTTTTKRVENVGCTSRLGMMPPRMHCIVDRVSRRVVAAGVPRVAARDAHRRLH